MAQFITYLFLILVSIGTAHSQCNVPADIVGEWWKSRNGKDNFVVYDAAGQEKYVAGTQVGDQYECKSDYESMPFHYYVRTLTTDTTKEECVELYEDQKVLFRRIIATTFQDFPAQQCLGIIGTGDPEVLLKYPFDFSGSRCGIPEGTYQTTYGETSPSDNICDGDANSVIEITGNKMDINTCYSGQVTYFYPHHTELTCVGTFSVTAIGDIADNGHVVVLADENGADPTFYCARYMPDYPNNVIRFSIATISEEEVVCKLGKDYKEAEPGKYIPFALKPRNCDLGVCLNGATCTEDLSTGYTCTCAPGYTGKNCETEINECESDPCLSGANCLDEVNGYTCECASGFTGVNCEDTFDACSNIHCQNSGTCIQSGNDWACYCVDGYSGVYCENEINECLSDPCENGATCIDELAAYRCECPDGFLGDNCQWQDQCTPNPCLNEGTCSNYDDGDKMYFRCECTANWTGKICDVEAGFDWMPLIIAGGVLGGLLLLILLLCCCWFCCARCAEMEREPRKIPMRRPEPVESVVIPYTVPIVPQPPPVDYQITVAPPSMGLPALYAMGPVSAPGTMRSAYEGGGFDVYANEAPAFFPGSVRMY